MKIGVIADTHIPSAGRELPPRVAQAFDGVDLILHAGDIIIPSCLDWLEQIAPVKAVELNAWSHFGGDSRVEERMRVMEFEGHSVGMVHELILPGMIATEVLPGAIDSHFPRDASLPGALSEFFGGPVGIVVMGYSHQAFTEEHNGVLFLNPGSATWPNNRVMPGTLAVLELAPGSRKVDMIDLKELG